MPTRLDIKPVGDMTPDQVRLLARELGLRQGEVIDRLLRMYAVMRNVAKGAPDGIVARHLWRNGLLPPEPR